MGDDAKKGPIQLDGVHVGDLVLRVVPTTGTDGHLDDPASRERDRRAEEDRRAAQRPGEVPVGPVTDATTQAAADVDASIAAARAAQAPGEAAMPILLRDPVTGEVIGSI